MNLRNLLMAGIVLAATVLSSVSPAYAQAKPKDEYVLAVSIYAGWMPWYHANEAGIIKKWADRYGIKVKVVYMDYLPSVEAYVAGKVDAVVATNMDALNMPAVAGIDSTALIVGDYSNGNDALLVRDIKTVDGLKGQEIYLVQGSVSHFALLRWLDQNGMKESDVRIVNISDSDIANAFISNKSMKACVTWNPLVMQIEQTPGVSRLNGKNGKPLDSAAIPGEILDLCVVNTATLNADPRFGEVLTGAWYETLELMQRRGAEGDKVLSEMARLAGCTLNEFKAQLKQTAMYWTPQSAADFTASPELKKTMDQVRQFSFAQGLFGEGAKSVDAIGIELADGTILGDKGKLKLRFTNAYHTKAAKGELKK